MKISPEYVGAVCKPLEVEVTARQCMNYAASIGDANTWHLDDAGAEGIVAPPMLAVALTWRISERFLEFWGDNDFPYEALARQVHYSERLQWERPMRPGERLRIEGEVAAILPHRAGTHLIIAYTAYDKNGSTVFVEHTGGLLRGVICDGEGRGVDGLVEYNNAADAMPFWSKELHVSKLAAHIYDGCADIHFPIHISPAFAKSVGLPGILLQGTATLAMAVREIIAVEADNDPRRLRAVGARFTGMVRPDSAISVRVLAKKETDNAQQCHFVVLNANGKPAISDGFVDIAAG